jgi:uroporphyrinogen-III synthase
MLTLVTRPEPQASAWASDLQHQGVPAASLPLMAIGPPPDPQHVQDAWQRLHQWRCVMIVSPNAAHWFAQLRLPTSHWPADTLLAAPGPGTAQVARTLLGPLGLTDEHLISPPSDSAQFDSEHLWPQLRSLDWSHQRVLVISGGEQGEARGRQWLTRQWQNAGATVDTLLTYQRHVPQWTDAQWQLARQAYADPAGHAWLFSSSQAVENLRALMASPPRQAIAVCTHPKVADTARALGFETIVDTRPQPHDVVQACLSLVTP